MALAASIEESLPSSISTLQLQQWMEELQVVLQATALSIEEYLQAPARAHAPKARAVSTSPAELDSAQRAVAQQALLERLRAGVRTDDPAQVEQHMPALAELWPGAQLQQLQALLDAFDFEGVNVWISTIERETENLT
jgi:hypothetical protein